MPTFVNKLREGAVSAVDGCNWLAWAGAAVLVLTAAPAMFLDIKRGIYLLSL